MALVQLILYTCFHVETISLPKWMVDEPVLALENEFARSWAVADLSGIYYRRFLGNS